ncbi:sensor domain-containing diguanylate cyclase [Vibrio alginolyticus]|uniref:sensor domain-containing diguanylate cyclase n=3 Tax=Vibrio harveyi group TaxID=717610 RepID=UPI0023ED4AAB|nr:diguanylate cyclase [Vibrio parahaemolyticus]
MKIKTRESNIKNMFYSCVLLTFLVVMALAFIFNEYQTQRERILSSASHELNSKIESSLGVYKDFSNYVFKEIEDDPNIFRLMSEAYFGDENIRTFNRNKIYSMLQEKYNTLTDFNFRQLHFHFKNGDSFLRVHKPEKFGDNLLSVRESVRIANKEIRFVQGFEEGRIYNGYRFVYPVIYNDIHIGTLEVSLSMGSIVNLLFDLYPEQDFFFLINKDVVDYKVFGDTKNNYIHSTIASDYYVDKSVLENNLEKLKFDELEGNTELLKEYLEPHIKTSNTFSHEFNVNGQYLIVSFISVSNFKDEHVAYLISISEDDALMLMKRNYLLFNFMIFIVLIAFFVIVFQSYRNQNKLLKMSATDFLTQLLNRNKMVELLSQEYDKTKRYNSTYTVMMFDIDYFKSINDKFGHSVGDDYLIEFSRLIHRNIRTSDSLARWGGEEFVLLLPNTDENNSILVAEKLRNLVENYSFSGPKNITVSIGISQVQSGDKSLDDAIARADKALYHSKENGRNQATGWSYVH